MYNYQYLEFVLVNFDMCSPLNSAYIKTKLCLSLSFLDYYYYLGMLEKFVYPQLDGVSPPPFSNFVISVREVLVSI